MGCVKSNIAERLIFVTVHLRRYLQLIHLTRFTDATVQAIVAPDRNNRTKCQLTCSHFRLHDSFFLALLVCRVFCRGCTIRAM